MFECGKAVARRIHDPMFARAYFVGHGIDIGSGNDPLDQYGELFPGMRSCRSWDTDDGNAQDMSGVGDNAFDFVHSSHCLEHMDFPGVAIANWLRILKPGGHMVCLVPDEDLYEQGVWPSTFNEDHKCSLTIWKGVSWSPVSVNILDLLRRDDIAVQYVKLLNATNRTISDRVDQTLTPIGESAIEFVVRKL
jgi:SAM-dependent methyltransferase